MLNDIFLVLCKYIINTTFTLAVAFLTLVERKVLAAMAKKNWA